MSNSHLPPHTQQTTDATMQRVASTEIFISRLLRGGVFISLSLVVLGTVLSFIHHPTYLHDTQILKGLIHPQQTSFPHTLPDVWTGLHNSSGQSVITLGLIVLIATPILRVAASSLIFWHERDRIFAGITAFVLALLLISLFLGKAGG